MAMDREKRRSRVAAALFAAAAALAVGFTTVQAQDSVAVTEAEGGRLWFVELAGAPVADGSSRSAVQAEKAAFRRNASAAGIRYTERRSYDVLFNGFAVEINPGDRMKLAQLSGVKAIYPVEVIAAPSPEQAAGAAPDLVAAITMTGAKVAQDTRGLSGLGVKVGVIDTGIDIDHPAFGGGGVPGGPPSPRRVWWPAMTSSVMPTTPAAPRRSRSRCPMPFPMTATDTARTWPASSVPTAAASRAWRRP